LYLQNIIKQQQHSTQSLSGPTQFTANPKNVKAASVVLLIVLLSFGLFFNQTSKNGLPRDLAGTEGLDLFQKEAKSLYAGRTLKSLDSDSIAPLPLLPSGVEEKQSAPVAAASGSSVVPVAAIANRKHALEAINEEVGNKRSSSSATSNKKKKMKISEEPESGLVDLPDNNNGKELSVVPLDGRYMKDTNNLQLASLSTSNRTAEVVQSFQMRDKPNTSYIYCSEAQHVAPVSDPQNIALLIPANVLNATARGLPIDTSLLEVTCQVMNYYIWPAGVAPATTASTTAPINSTGGK